MLRRITEPLPRRSQIEASTPADLLVDFFARRDANAHLSGDRQALDGGLDVVCCLPLAVFSAAVERASPLHTCRRLLELNAQGQAEVAGELAQLLAAVPASKRRLESAKRLALSLPEKLVSVGGCMSCTACQWRRQCIEC